MSEADLREQLYRLTRQPERWPLLIDDFDQLAAEQETPALLASLQPHLQVVLCMQERLQQSRDALNEAQQMLELLPQPLALIDRDLQLLGANSAFYQGIGQSQSLSLNPAGNLLCHSNRLSDFIAAQFSGKDAPCTLLDESEGIGFTATPIRDAQCAPPLALLLSLDRPGGIDLDATRLHSRYALTPAELRLAQALASGHSMEECARAFSRTLATLRSQLASLLGKTGTANQGELIHLLLRDPLLIGTPQRPPSPAACTLRDGAFTLDDGRTLGYARYGEEGGVAVVQLHGFSGCRFQVPPEMTVEELQGVTLYLPERPGYGLSSPRRGHRVLEWCDDLRQFIERGVGQGPVILIGMTAGSMHAMAFATRYPQWVSRLLLVSPSSPFSWRDALRMPRYRALHGLARLSPALLMPLVATMMRLVQQAPTEFLLSKECDVSPQELAHVHRDEFRRAMLLIMDESTSQGVEHFAEAIVQLSRSWEFQPEAVSCPVTLWHGECDQYIPVALVRRLSERLPDCRAHWVEDASHLLYFTHWRVIVQACRDGGGDLE